MFRVCVACRGQRLEAISEELRYEYEEAGVTTAWRYRWLRCEVCGLSMLDPEPSVELLQRFYRDNSAPASDLWSQLKSTASLLRARIGSLGNGFTLLTLGLALQLPKDAVILDLACADGNWLSLLASCGYRRLHGHIVSVPSARVAERLTFLRSYGIAITEGSFASQEYPSASFDCIRIRDGLSTLTEPAATVRQCLRMLKPTGVLLLQVPHPAAAWVCLTRAQAAKPQDAPCHVYHHTADALSSLLSAAGFRDLQALAPNDTSSLIPIVNNMRHQAGKAPVPMLLSLLLRPAYTFTRMFQGVSDFREQRDWLTLVAREPAVLRQHAPQNENGQSRATRQRGFRPALFTRS